MLPSLFSLFFCIEILKAREAKDLKPREDFEHEDDYTDETIKQILEKKSGNACNLKQPLIITFKIVSLVQNFIYNLISLPGKYFLKFQT